VELLLHRSGGWVTLALLGSPARHRSWSRELYRRLYLLGKAAAESPLRAFVRQLARPGDVVFDVGANAGSYARLFATAVGPTGRVHAFEPDPLAGSLLRRTCRGLRNVEISATAVGDAVGTATLHTSRRNRADNRLHRSHETADAGEEIGVPLITLDAYCAQNGVDRLDLLKVDVQGWEVAVLRGARATLARLRPAHLLLEISPAHLRHAGASSEELLSLVAELGYASWSLADPRAPVPLRDDAALATLPSAEFVDVWARRDVAVR
jgi:FkbM family methyltransferase